MTVVNPKSISGITSITTASGSDNLLTIHTSDASNTERLRINSSGDVIVGSGITASPDGDIFATGVTTSTTFVGALTGNVTGTIQTASQTNITSVGTLTGLTVSGDVNIADKIFHTGDSDTAIRFPAADTITAETGGSERIRIDSSGRLLIGTTTEGHVNGDDLTVATSGNTGITIRSGTSDAGNIYFSDATSGDGEYKGYISYAHNVDGLYFATGAANRMFIDSSGRTLIGTTSQNNNARLQVTTDQQVVATFEGTGSSDPQIYLGDDMSSPTDNCIILGYDKADNRGYLTVGGDADTVFQVKNGGDIEIGVGNLVIGTSGKGIDFSNASGSYGGSDSSTLDDYEEGTWTLGVAHDGITAEYGRYTKIGRMVYATFEITFGSSSNSGHQYISGLPFTAQASSDNGGNAGGVARDYQNYDIENGPIYHIGQNNTLIYFYKNSGQTMAASNTSGYNFRGTAVYTAA